MEDGGAQENSQASAETLLSVLVAPLEFQLRPHRLEAEGARREQGRVRQRHQQLWREADRQTQVRWRQS